MTSLAPQAKTLSQQTAPAASASDDAENRSRVPTADPDAKYATLMQTIHWTGAFFAFVSGAVWLFVNTELTRRMGERAYFAARLVVSVLYAFFLFTGIALAVVAATHGNGMSVAWFVFPSFFSLCLSCCFT